LQSRLASEVDDHPPRGQITDRLVGTGVAQPSQILAAEAIEFVRDEQLAIAAVLDRSPCG
jgi:hypothetical protein